MQKMITLTCSSCGTPFERLYKQYERFNQKTGVAYCSHACKGVGFQTATPALHETANGYLVFYRCRGGKRVRIYYHRWVWEQAHGVIPKGMHIHHRDKNKHNCALENLEMLTVVEHKRAHSSEGDIGATRQCSVCSTWNPYSEYDPRENGPMRRQCRKCRIAYTVKRHREKRKAEGGELSRWEEREQGLRRRCTACGIRKPDGEFYLVNGSPTSKCKPCFMTYQAGMRAALREKQGKPPMRVRDPNLPRECTRCGEGKPDSEFYVKGGKLNSRCKSCVRELSEKRRVMLRSRT